MKKFLLILSFTFIAIQYNFANNIDFTPSKNQKIEGTFSGDIDQKQSVHLIFSKNKTTKNYEIIPFLMDELDKITQLKTITFTKSPGLSSYHLNNNILTVILNESHKNKSQFYHIIDYNLDTSTKTQKKIEKKDGDYTIRQTNCTYIINPYKTYLNIQKIENSKSYNQHQITPTNSEKFKEIFKGNYLDVVNTNEFVKNGSINKLQTYLENDKLVFTKLNDKTNSINSIAINLKDFSYKFKNFENNDLKDNKDINSYVHNQNLFSLLVNKKDAIVKVNKLESGEELFKKSLINDFNNFEKAKIENIIKKASKNKNKPTITINKSIENKMVVTIDYVDSRVYNYNFNWWFHHWMWQQQQWQTQQMVNEMIQNQMSKNIQNLQQFKSYKGFGPNPEFYDHLYIPTISNTKSIKFVLNSNFDIDKKASTKTIKKDLNRDKYLDPLKNNSDLKHITASFQKETFRYIYFSKKLNKFYIKSSKLR